MEEEQFEAVSMPEITPYQLSEWMQNSHPDLVLLDVREPYEFPRAKISDARVVYAPLSELARKYLDALPPAAQDKAATLVVFCHHGVRSAQVTTGLLELGWQSVYNLSGGIDAFARQVDPQVGLY